MKAKKVFEKFVEDSDPIKDMGIGLSLYERYLKLIEENPHLRMKYKGKEVQFEGDEDNPKTIGIYFHKAHPMSGQFGRTSNLSYNIGIRYIKHKYRLEGRVFEEGYTRFKEEFDTLKEALEFIIPYLEGIHSYY